MAEQTVWPGAVEAAADLPTNITNTTLQKDVHKKYHNIVNGGLRGVEQSVADLIAAQLNQARVKTAAGAQTVNTGTLYAVQFGAEDYDGNSMHDNAVNNTRITCKLTGKYLVIGGLYWDVQTLGTVTFLLSRLHKNGAIIEGSRQHMAPISSFSTNGQGQISSAIINLAVTDYVELVAFHDKTAAGTLTIATTTPSTLMMSYLGP